MIYAPSAGCQTIDEKASSVPAHESFKYKQPSISIILFVFVSF